MTMINTPSAAQNFKAQQAKFARVQTAMEEKGEAVKSLFAAKNLDYPAKEIYLRVFKREGVLELWANHKGRYQLVKEYKICAASGELGPKRRQGDNQVPEGFYLIDRFNPLSNFYLSLGVNYPNQADRIFGAGGNLGGDIFIHGNCVSIGCVAITDDQIKELYLIAVEARAAGQMKIPVHIFPARMHPHGMKRLEREAAQHPALWNFWRNLQGGYEVFETHHRLPVVTVDRQGRYIIK
ncbi:MAG: L,D-transpeptidase family protein [Acidobacteria bacterium]|nr:L,D-transpeptidase family protein [Acidobacteriota bacterium]